MLALMLAQTPRGLLPLPSPLAASAFADRAGAIIAVTTFTSPGC
jgi:hypothetical protein